MDNINQEIERIEKMNLRIEAVADKKFRQQLDETVAQDHSSVVTLQKYEPNQLIYEVESSKDGVVVLSETYYPEWAATVDGEEVPVGRVSYILRAIQAKLGKHTVVLSFFPKSVSRIETIAYVSSALLVALIILVCFNEFRKRKQKEGKQV